MPPAATRRSHGTRRARSNVAPRHPRRVSGPARAATAPAVALPRPGTGVFERLRALPDHRVVDRLLRGRACIWIIGLALGGIVAMQVSLLKLNSGISRAVEASGTLQRQNADLESSIARLASGERIRAAAVKAGAGLPAAGDARYLRARPGYDVSHALRRMRPPSAEAKAVIAHGGAPPGVGVPRA